MSQVRDGWSTTGTGGADQGTVRRANLSLVLRSLREGGARSRARLAADLGLNKATVSSLVTELRERGLVREGSAERGAVGRPGTIVEIDGAGAYGLGAEINVHHVSTRAVDLAGAVVSERRTSVDTRGLEPDEVVDRLVELVHGTLADLAALGAAPVSAVVGSGGPGRPRPRHRLGRGQPRVAGRRAGQPAARQARRPRLPPRGGQRGQPRRRRRGHPRRPRAPRHPRHPRRGRHRWRHRRRRPAVRRTARLRRRVRPHGRRPRRQPVRLRSHRVLGDRHRPQPPHRAGRRRRGRPAAIARPRPRGQGRGDQPPRRRRRRADPGRAERGRPLGRHRRRDPHQRAQPRDDRALRLPRRDRRADPPPRSSPSSPPGCSPPTRAARASRSRASASRPRCTVPPPSPSTTSTTTPRSCPGRSPRWR